MSKITLEINDAKLIALKIKDHEERVRSLPISAPLKEQLVGDIKEIKDLFQKAKLKEG